jgi:hypothetical protein
MERTPLRTLCHNSPLKLAEHSSKHAGHTASHASRHAAHAAQRHNAPGKRARTATPPRHLTSEWAPQLTAAGHAGCEAAAPSAAAAEPDSGRSLGSYHPGGGGPASSPAPPPVSPWAAELLDRWDGRWDTLLSPTPSTPTAERPAVAPHQPRAPDSPGRRAPPDAAAPRRTPLAQLVAAVEAEVAADAACARAGAAAGGAAGGPGPEQDPAQTLDAGGGGDDTDELLAALLGAQGRPRGPGQGQGQGLRSHCAAVGGRDPQQARSEADQGDAEQRPDARCSLWRGGTKALPQPDERPGGEAAKAGRRTARRDAREADVAAGGRSRPDGQRGGAPGEASAGRRAACGAGAGGARTGRLRAVRCRAHPCGGPRLAIWVLLHGSSRLCSTHVTKHRPCLEAQKSCWSC